MTAFYVWIGGLAQRGILPADFQYPFLVRGFFCVLVLAPILGGVSHLVVTRRMAFFSAALGQAAITGVALGLADRRTFPTVDGGMFGFCLLSTVAMVYVKRRHGDASGLDTQIGGSTRSRSALACVCSSRSRDNSTSIRSSRSCSAACSRSPTPTWHC